MKTSILILLLCLLGSFSVAGQTPIFEWAKSIGSTGNDEHSIPRMDKYGNIYICGTFTDSIDVDPGPGEHYLYTYPGSPTSVSDVFICKIDPNGNLLWGKSFGNQNKEATNVMDIDPEGNIYITGQYRGLVDFDPGDAVHSDSLGGIYILHLNSDGEFVWVKTLQAGISYDISLDEFDNIYIYGIFSYIVDFDPGTDTFLLYSALYSSLIKPGASAGFILKLNKDGNFVWAKAFEQENSLGHFGAHTIIRINANQEVYISGTIRYSSDFDPGPGKKMLYSSGPDGSADPFLLKLNKSGDFLWVKQFKGYGHAYLDDFLMDEKGDLFICGRSHEDLDCDPDTGTTILKVYGTYNGYLIKLDKEGKLIWAHGLNTNSGSNSTIVNMTLDKEGSLYYTGSFKGICDFAPASSIFNLPNSDVGYISKIDKDGNFEWAISDFMHWNTWGHIFVNNNYDILSVDRLYYPNAYDYDPSAAVFKLTPKTTNDISIRKLNQPTLKIHNQNLTQNAPLIFPNPTNGEVFIEFISNQLCNKIIIQNVFGQKVKEIDTKPNHKLQLDIKEFANGVYFLCFFDNYQQFYVQKIIKQ